MKTETHLPGAIKASSENAGISINHILTKTQNVSSGLSGEQVVMIFDLINHGNSRKRHLDSKEKRTYRKIIIPGLNNAGIRNEESLANHMLDLGITSEFELIRK